MNALVFTSGGTGMAQPKSSARMVGKLGLGAAALGMATFGAGILGSVPAAHADITGSTPFGSNTNQISVSSSSGYAGQGTNGTMTFNAQGISGLTGGGNGSQTVPPQVADGWYSAISSNTSVLKVTFLADGEDSSAWFNTPQNVAHAWTTSFTWNQINLSAGGSGGGFGFFFALQNTTQGLSYIGGQGPNMGLTTNGVIGTTTATAGELTSATIPANTIGIGINNTSGTYLNSGIAGTSVPDSTNGMLQVVYGTTILNVPVTGVDFLGTATSGPNTPDAPVNITISYNGVNSLLFTAVQGSNTFSDTIALPGTLASIVGGNTAYVGFTATTAAQQFGPAQGLGITNFSYVPEPAALSLLVIGGLGLLLLKRRRMA